MPEVSPRRPMIGRVLDGRYRVVAHLADGGMATVWCAVDERLDRHVAVKVLRRSLAEDPTVVARFRAEARTAARLNDPRVVAVYDQGEDGGDPFLAMELVPGRTLREIVHDDAPLAPVRALDLLEPVAEALGVAHRAGLLHRDVKPENVLVRDDGRVKVADFGLARAVTTATTRVTGAAMLGTVAYLAPEQVEQGRADARSDVYALGVVVYELLTGRAPYEGGSPIHVAYQHVHATARPPSSLVTGLPVALDELVARLMARDPADRPADGVAAAALVRATRARLGDPPAAATTTAHRPATTPTTALPVLTPTPAVAPTQTLPVHDPTAPVPQHRRRRGPAVAAATALLGAGCGAGWWFAAGPGATTTVPEVTRVTADEATGRLAAAHLDAVRAEVFSETVPDGTVLAVAPTAGTSLHRGDDVTLTVSKGPDRTKVPALAGATLDAVRATLVRERLALGTVTRRFDEQAPQGQVVATTPGPGSAARPNSSVDVVVSKGRAPIDVPRVTGVTLDQARARVEALGLRLDADPATMYSTSVPKGSVVSQRPRTGTLFRGDAVTVVVSKGPEMVTVPTVVGRSLDDARAALQAAGFQVKVTEVLGGMFGIVREQSTGGGDQAPKGSTITLTVV